MAALQSDDKRISRSIMSTTPKRYLLVLGLMALCSPFLLWDMVADIGANIEARLEYLWFGLVKCHFCLLTAYVFAANPSFNHRPLVWSFAVDGLFFAESGIRGWLPHTNMFSSNCLFFAILASESTLLVISIGLVLLGIKQAWPQIVAAHAKKKGIQT